MQIFIAVLDKLIPKNKAVEKHDLFVQRSFITIMLFMLLLASSSFLAKHLFNYNDPFPFWLILIIVPCILYINKSLNNTTVAIHVFNTIMYVLLGYLLYITGGIFSINVKWVFIMLFLALLFLPIKQIIIWQILILSLVLAIFWGVNTDITTLPGYDKLTYLIDNVVFILAFSTFIIIYYIFQNLLREDLHKQQQATARQAVELQAQSQKIAEVSRLLEQSNLRLKNYAHTTSHDLRQPLRTITSFVELIKADIVQNKITDATKEYMEFVIDASRKGNKLVDDILVFAQVEHIENKPKELISTEYLLSNVTKSLGRQIKETNAEITVNSNLPAIYGNPSEIERVFQNIISNALKFAKKNISPKVNLICNTNQTMHTFIIEDYGIGIQPQSLSNIFKSFVRENRTNKFGQGIGLSTCKEIIEEHGGKIWIESEPNVYTRFFFTIPKLV